LMASVTCNQRFAIAGFRIATRQFEKLFVVCGLQNVRPAGTSPPPRRRLRSVRGKGGEIRRPWGKVRSLLGCSPASSRPHHLEGSVHRNRAPWPPDPKSDVETWRIGCPNVESRERGGTGCPAPPTEVYLLAEPRGAVDCQSTIAVEVASAGVRPFICIAPSPVRAMARPPGKQNSTATE
jgi:hypothetical protein